MQITIAEECAYCRRKTDIICDWCALRNHEARPICPRHRYTRHPWAHEVHLLCFWHAEQLAEMHACFLRDHPAERTQPGLWYRLQAHHFEPYADVIPF